MIVITDQSSYKTLINFASHYACSRHYIPLYYFNVREKKLFFNAREAGLTL